MKFEPKYTDEQRQEIIRLYAEGVPVNLIMEKFGCGHASPGRLARQAGVPMRRRTWVGLLKSGNPTWTDEQDAQLRAAWAAGRSLLSIGNEMGKSRGSIGGRLTRLGLMGQRPKRVKAPRPRHIRQGDFSHRTGLARPTLRKVARKVVQAPPLVPRLPMPAKPTTPPVLFRGRRMGFECAFIPGDPRSPLVMVCGAPVEHGTEWCPWHLRMVAA